MKLIDFNHDSRDMNDLLWNQVGTSVDNVWDKVEKVVYDQLKYSVWEELVISNKPTADFYIFYTDQINEDNTYRPKRKRLTK
jgi:hypothetical protein